MMNNNNGDGISSCKAFLDAKVSTYGSLSSIPSLLTSLESEQTVIKEKVEHLLSDSVKGKFRKKTLGVINDIENLEKRRAVSHSELMKYIEASSSLTSKLSPLISKVDTLEKSKQYLTLLLQINTIYTNALSFLNVSENNNNNSSNNNREDNTQTTQNTINESTHHPSLSPLFQLVEYQNKINSFLSTNSGGVKNLKSVVDAMIKDLAEKLGTKIKGDYKKSLEGMGWPQPLTKSVGEPNLLKFRTSFNQLLFFQLSLKNNGIVDMLKSIMTTPTSTRDSLWVLDLLLEPLAIRFFFHFSDRKQPTARVDKPEWPLHHIRKLIQDNLPFLVSIVQPLIEEENLTMYNVKVEFIRGLMIMLNAKFRKEIDMILADYNLLLHTIKEFLSFEKNMRGTHGYPIFDSGKDFVRLQNNLPSVILVFEENEKVFSKWLDVEIDLSLGSFQSIITHESAWLPYFSENLQDVDNLKPTRSAHQLVDLLEAITERYKYLSHAEYQIEFLTKIQIHILWQYHNTIKLLSGDSIGEVQVKKSSPSEERSGFLGMGLLGFGFGGLGAKQKASLSFSWTGNTGWNTEQISHCCYLINSVNYFVHILKDWGDQILFLELHNLMGQKENVEKTGTIFDDLISAYKVLRTALSEMLEDVIFTCFSSHSNVYFKRKKLWLGGVESEELSPDICEPLLLLKEQIEVTEKNISSGRFFKFWKSFAQRLDNFVFKQVISGSHHFGKGGGEQFSRDMKALFLIFRPFTEHPENFFKTAKELSIVLTLSYEDCLALQKKDVDIPTLNKYGIYKLIPSQVLEVLNLRLDLQQFENPNK